MARLSPLERAPSPSRAHRSLPGRRPSGWGGGADGGVSQVNIGGDKQAIFKASSAAKKAADYLHACNAKGNKDLEVVAA